MYKNYIYNINIYVKIILKFIYFYLFIIIYNNIIIYYCYYY